jgi:hypothetical protein
MAIRNAPTLARIGGKTIHELMGSDSGALVFSHGEVIFAAGIESEDAIHCRASIPVDLRALVVEIGKEGYDLVNVFAGAGSSFVVEHGQRLPKTWQVTQGRFPNDGCRGSLPDEAVL